MDRICSAVLQKTNSMATLGRYVIISDDEFFEAFPDGEEKSGASLLHALNFLREEGFIDLRYSHGNMYCVAPLKNYEPPADEQNAPLRIPPPAVQSAVKAGKFNLPAFFAAFAGGAAGSFIISLIFALINA